jgi:hypothetical protein
MLTNIPNGLDEILATFGSVDVPGDFEARHIVMFDLPYPLVYDGRTVSRSRAHRLAVPHFVFAFEQIAALGLEDQCRNYGGIYNRRSVRGARSHLSTHSWGISIDLEPERFPLGSRDRFDPRIIQCFARAGFFYGGDFRSRKDPMHFQLCTGY